MMIQDLDDTVVGKRIHVYGRRPCQVLELIEQNGCPIKRTIMRVVFEGDPIVVKVRFDTPVEVDV